MRKSLILLTIGPSCGAMSPAETLRQALIAADRGDPAAWDLCLELEQGQGRGLCKVEASRNVPRRAEACASITRELWRSECWFVYAEDLATAGDWPAAINACRRAELFVGDCGRHLWTRASELGDPALVSSVLSAFPGCNEALPAEMVAVVADRADAVADARARDAELAEIAANAKQEALFRDAPTIDLSACQGDEEARCVRVGQDVFRQRWEHSLTRDPLLADTLCAGTRGGRRRLDPGADERLIAVVEELKRSHCAEGNDQPGR